MKTENLRAGWKWRGFQAHFIFRRGYLQHIRFKRVGLEEIQLRCSKGAVCSKKHRWIIFEGSFWVLNICVLKGHLKGHFSRVISCFGEIDAVSKHVEKRRKIGRLEKNPETRGSTSRLTFIWRMSGRAQCGTHLELGVYQCRKAQGFAKKFTLPNEIEQPSLSMGSLVGGLKFYFGSSPWNWQRIYLWVWAFCPKNKGLCSNQRSWYCWWLIPALGFEMEKNTPTMLTGGFKDFLFSSLLGKWSNLTNIFQMGWNHQLDKVLLKMKTLNLCSKKHRAAIVTLKLPKYMHNPFPQMPDKIIYTWNPNDPCFAWKRPSFFGFDLPK